MRFGSPRFRHPAAIEGLAVSPDGKVAAACSGTQFHNSARAYDLTTGGVLYALDDSVSDVQAVAFSPDGKTLATKPFSAERHWIHLHDAATGRETGRIACPGVADGLAFSPDGKRIAFVAEGRRALHLLDVARGEVVRTLPHTDLVFALAFSPDGKHVAGGGYDKEDGVYFARLWEADTGKEARRFPVGKSGIRSLAFSADGSTLAAGEDYGAPPVVKLFDAATAREWAAIPFPYVSGIRSVTFSPEGKTLAAAGGPSIRLFDTATGKERVRIDRQATGLRFTPDGASLVGAVAGTVYRWDAATGRSLIPEGGDSPVAQVAVSADGKRVVSLGQDGDGHVWDARTGQHQRRVGMTRQHGFALSPDGRFLVWPAVDETVQYERADAPNAILSGNRLRMLDAADGTPVDRFGGFGGDAYDLFFTADGRTLVTVDHHHQDAGVRVWDVATGRIVRSFPADGGPRATVRRSRLSPDGKAVAVTYHQDEGGLAVRTVVKLWDTASAKELGDQAPWAEHEVAALSPDGKTMATASPDGTISYRDAAGQVRGEIRGPRGRVTALAFGPDGRLYSGCRDATVLVWEPRAAGRPPADRK
jgi:WD40 repeat protein